MALRVFVEALLEAADALGEGGALGAMVGGLACGGGEGFVEPGEVGVAAAESVVLFRERALQVAALRCEPRGGDGGEENEGPEEDRERVHVEDGSGGSGRQRPPKAAVTGTGRWCRCPQSKTPTSEEPSSVARGAVA